MSQFEVVSRLEEPATSKKIGYVCRTASGDRVVFSEGVMRYPYGLQKFTNIEEGLDGCLSDSHLPVWVLNGYSDILSNLKFLLSRAISAVDQRLIDQNRSPKLEINWNLVEFSRGIRVERYAYAMAETAIRRELDTRLHSISKDLGLSDRYDVSGEVGDKGWVTISSSFKLDL